MHSTNLKSNILCSSLHLFYLYTCTFPVLNCLLAEAVSNQGPSAYQSNALPLGQTGSLCFCVSLSIYMCVCVCAYMQMCVCVCGHLSISFFFC